MKKNRVWKAFIINISLVILLFLSGIFIGFVFKTNRIIRDQLVTTARAHFNNIVLTRRWNANYGGVYVKKVKGVVSNPYLENPDITTADGTVYTKKNPALMTREVSRYAQESGDFQYHITSLKPLNPGNAPDDFETESLKSFENQDAETFRTVTRDGRSIFRYMAPLYVEKGCLSCHGKQGYEAGDVRGGISVSFDITEVENKVRKNNIIVSVLSAGTSIALLGIIFLLVSRLAGKLSNAYRTIEIMSITDELTRVYNRRYFQERLNREIARSRRYGLSLSLLLMDIDHFKKVNDDFGHLSGDAILTAVAALVKARTREIDTVARFGGEEFAVILPETDETGAVKVAEKVRLAIEGEAFNIPGQRTIAVTSSFGVSSLNMLQGATGDDYEQIIKLADDALYSAKNQGRNRTVKAGALEE